VKYAWIHEQCDVFPVPDVRCLCVSRSGYYDSLGPYAKPAGQRRERIQPRCGRVLPTKRHLRQRQDCQGLATAPRLGVGCRNTIARAMREMGPEKPGSQASRRQPPRRSHEATGTQYARPRLRGRSAQSQVVTDITYLQRLAGWVYLAVVIDLFRPQGGRLAMSNRCDHISERRTASSIEARRPDGKHLLHIRIAVANTPAPPISEPCKPGHRLLMSPPATVRQCRHERFFWSLKYEWTTTKRSITWKPQIQRLQIHRTFYNSQRLHQTLGYQSPNQYETVHPRWLRRKKRPALSESGWATAQYRFTARSATEKAS